MAFRFRLSQLLLAASVATAATASAQNFRHRAHAIPAEVAAAATGAPSNPHASASASATAGATRLPALPDGVEALTFNELFQQPIGPRGLEFSDKLRRLDGRRVRILGYMVEQSQPAPHCLLLSPRPVELHEDEWGFSEDLPATTIHAFVSADSPALVPFTPGPLLLTGTLSIGNRAEADQRISTVRLQLDAPAAALPSTASTPVATAPVPDAAKR